MTELLEKICTNMHSYAKSVDPNGNTNYFRTSSRDGSPISLKNAELSGDIGKSLKFAVSPLFIFCIIWVLMSLGFQVSGLPDVLERCVLTAQNFLGSIHVPLRISLANIDPSKIKY